MPASTNQECLQFEEFVEPQIVAALVAAGIPEEQVFSPRSQRTFITPSISVRLVMGAPALNHKFNPPTLSYYVADMFACQIQAEVRTNRGADTDKHKEFRSLMRLVMANIFATVNPLLTLHAFAFDAAENGSTDILADDATNHDVSQISFGSTLAIKPDAWPAA